MRLLAGLGAWALDTIEAFGHMTHFAGQIVIAPVAARQQAEGQEANRFGRDQCVITVHGHPVKA